MGALLLWPLPVRRPEARARKTGATPSPCPNAIARAGLAAADGVHRGARGGGGVTYSLRAGGRPGPRSSVENQRHPSWGFRPGRGGVSLYAATDSRSTNHIPLSVFTPARVPRPRERRTECGERSRISQTSETVNQRRVSFSIPKLYPAGDDLALERKFGIDIVTEFIIIENK